MCPKVGLVVTYVATLFCCQEVEFLPCAHVYHVQCLNDCMETTGISKEYACPLKCNRPPAASSTPWMFVNAQNRGNAEDDRRSQVWSPADDFVNEAERMLVD